MWPRSRGEGVIRAPSREGEEMAQLDYVRDFLRDIWRNLEPGEMGEFDGQWFSRAGKGSIFLSGPETIAYMRVVSRLVEEHGQSGGFSRGTLGT
jgi:hypothetical protein